MEFKSLPNYEGIYQVSNTGLIKSLERYVFRKDGFKFKIKERFLKSTCNRNGYLQVTLYDISGNKKLCNIHRLVAQAFLGIAPTGIEVNHKDRNRKNNNINNLEYVTARENVIHAIDKSKTSSKYIGVRKYNNKWRASKTINGKRFHLGTFETEEEASRRYKEFNSDESNY